MIDSLLAFPAILKILLSFAGMLLLYRLRVPLGGAMLLFSAVLTLWSGAGFGGLILLGRELLQPGNLLLVLAIVLLLLFTEVLKRTGRMEQTVRALYDWIGPRRELSGAFPALIGLLPMPGGALFSAPMVETLSGNRVPPPHKAALNYWFRHIWEYWWPLYPGVIMAVHYSGLSLPRFILTMIPLTFIAVGAGYALIIRPVQPPHIPDAPRQLDRRAAARSLVPVAALILFSLLMPRPLEWAGLTRTNAGLLSMIAGLCTALIICGDGKPWRLLVAVDLFKERRMRNLTVLVAGVLAFSASLQLPVDGGVSLVGAMRNELMQRGFPLLVTIIFLPFISGLVTGIALGFVGASFPLIYPLLGSSPEPHVLMAATVAAYACGYAGMILSPVHVCFVVTCEYFKTRLVHVYRHILGPAAIVLTGALLIAGLYYRLGK